MEEEMEILKKVKAFVNSEEKQPLYESRNIIIISKYNILKYYSSCI